MSSDCPGFHSAPRNRREFLKSSGLGFGWMALCGLLPAWHPALASAKPTA